MGCNCKKKNQEVIAQQTPVTIRLTEVKTPSPTSIPTAPPPPNQ